MVDWIVGKLKWLLLVCMVGGPIVAFGCWQDGERRREVMAGGTETVADIDGATRVKRRRGGTTYKLDLAWDDGNGQRHIANDVTISPEFARQVIVNDRLTVGSLAIKFMPSPGDGATRDDGLAVEKENLIILHDTAHQEQTDQELVYVGAGAGIFGMIGSALMFLPWRRRREVPELAR